MRKQAGQTLLEILLAFGVSILVLTAIVFGITTSLSNAQYTKNQNLANSYAQEGMAVVRQIRDSSWNDFKNLKDIYATNTRYCLGSDLKLGEPIDYRQSCGKNVGEIFSREIIFDHRKEANGCCSDASAGCSNATSTAGSKVTARVSWTDNKCPIGTPYCHKVELITCFSSIDFKSAP